MSIELPTAEQWVQRNRGDMLGNLQGTFNCDFTKVLGKTRVTRMIQTTAENGGNPNLTGAAVGFVAFTLGASTVIYTAAGTAGGRVHKSGMAIPSSPFTLETTSGTPTDCDSTTSDIITFGLNLYVASSSILNKLTNAGVWSTIGTFNGTSGVPHMMATFNSRLYVSDYYSNTGAASLWSIADGDTSLTTSGAYTLTLTNCYITWIRAASNKLWIGTISKTGKGYVYEWDGTTVNSPTAFYKLEAQGTVSCVIKDDIPWIVDTNGRLLQFSNGTFSEVARFPINDQLLLNATSQLNNRFIHPNGMSIVNGKINILLNNVLGDSATSINEFCPSGIWEYDDIIFNPYTGSSIGSGLYHKYALSYTPIGTNTITDYGQNRINMAGGLSEMKLVAGGAGETGNLIAGAMVYINGTTAQAGIFTNDTLTAITGANQNTTGLGYVVSTKQYALDEKGNTSIQNTWQNVYTLYAKLLTAASKILVKYRTVHNSPLEIPITWTSTTTFTTTTSLLGLEGYEVEGIQGTGSGYTAHIVKTDVTAGLYTTTIDDAFTGASGTAKVRIQNWKKISTITQNQATVDQAGMGDMTNWVQFKVCMVFSSTDELERLLIVNQNTYPIH